VAHRWLTLIRSQPSCTAFSTSSTALVSSLMGLLQRLQMGKSDMGVVMKGRAYHEAIALYCSTSYDYIQAGIRVPDSSRPACHTETVPFSRA
jgi:hypothetical protein